MFSDIAGSKMFKVEDLNASGGTNVKGYNTVNPLTKTAFVPKDVAIIMNLLL